MTNFYSVEHLGDDATDEQLKKLRETLETLLTANPDSFLDEAHRIRDDYMDRCDLSEDVDTLNQDVQWEIEDMLYEHVDTFIDSGLLPETDGEAHDVVSAVVGEVASNLLNDVQITEEDIYIEQEQMRQEHDPDYEYERRRGV